MPYARKKDRTHQIVLDALRIYGWTILDVSRAPLCVDLVIAQHDRVVLVEVKDRLGKLTEAQKLLLSSWPGETAVLRSLEDVARLTADVRKNDWPCCDRMMWHAGWWCPTHKPEPADAVERYRARLR